MSSCHSLHTSSCSSQQPKCFLHSSLNFVTIRHHTFPTKLHTTPFTVLHCIFLLRYSQASTHASNSSAHGASQLSTAFSQPSFTWLLHFPKTFPVFLCSPHNSSHSPVHSLASLTQYSQCYTHTHTHAPRSSPCGCSGSHSCPRDSSQTRHNSHTAPNTTHFSHLVPDGT